MFAPGDVARAEQAQRHHRVGDARLAHDECRQQRQRERAEAERVSRAPAAAAGLEDRVHEQHQRAGDEHRAGNVGALRAGRSRWSRLDQPQREQPGRDPDREVHEEDPVPVDRLGDRTAGQQPDRAAAGGDEAVDADRLGLLPRLREHRHDHAEDHRRRQRAARALQEARADQTLPATARPRTASTRRRTRPARSGRCAGGRSGRPGGRPAAAGRRT